MPTIRAPLTTVLAKLRSEIEDEAKGAAGSNTTISKAEQGQLKDSVTKTAADEIRAAGGPGTTVSVDTLVDVASSRMAFLIGTVNQTTGAGATTVSQDEVKALAAVNPDAGVRVARAYELITGKKIALDDVVPVITPEPPGGGGAIGDVTAVHAQARAFVLTYLEERSGGNNAYNAEERAALPSGFIRDAAYATAPPRTAFNIMTHLFNSLDLLFTDCGFDIVHVGQPDATPITAHAFQSLLARHPEAAGLIADAIVATGGARPTGAGLPPPRFTSTPPTPAPVPTPMPVTPAETWAFGDVRDRARGLLMARLQQLSGGNQKFSAAERAALPEGILFTAGMVVADTGTGLVTSSKIADEVMAVVDFNLSMVGLTPALASDPSVGITLDQLARLVLENREIAGLIADAMAEHRQPRPEVPDLPPARFMISTPWPPVDTTLTGPVLTGVPGASGPVRTHDPARIEEHRASLAALVDAMDYSRNGTVTLGEAQAFVGRAGGGTMWDPQIPPENRPRTIERMLYDVREAAYQRFGRSPTTAEIKAELALVATRAGQIGVDDNNNGFDANGPARYEDEISAFIFFDSAREPSIDLHAEPYVRFFDHEGDVAVDKRRPLDLGGPAAKAIRNLVFHFNKAENDNHWPLWSGKSTSRYRLDVDELTPLIARLKQEPVARQQELFQALVDWLGWHSSRPGLAYVNVPARPLIDAYAVELGHAYRSPTGETTAPSMPSP